MADRGFIDLHAHILPGLDDGPPDWDAFFALARQSAGAGVSVMAATVHSDGEKPFPKGLYTRVLKTARRRLEEAGIPLRLVSGSEILLGPFLGDRLSEGALIGLAGTAYHLLELPFTQLPLYTEDALFRLRLAGGRPILAHPERCRYLAEDPALARSLTARGAAFQVNASSLLGEAGRRIRGNALDLLEEGLCHLVASDCHDAETRPQRLPQALELVEAYFGPETAERLFFENPRRILAGEILLEAPEPPPPDRRPFWKKLLGR